ncbi:hypothetical protein WJ95_17070 [Burkholderia ubonensis]|uniref:DUF3761 domain-containing protein n=1 Tax=Burkholderia ubonensis TaxID=101571 RepID=A0A106JJU1_9BURK|nr:DUF3761 domain-containing protein [Burkholderia ubonensis]AJX17381.1 hypothetical protein BW23_1228 [Burkholderia ubonensis MSMB22]AOK22304.1 hypothetical protein WK67_05820 [Burkholderia ubonensis]KVC91359.1 hypothetical protein WI78_26380 [Burkholderia ubonensis]KVD05149.1 hypothetical protein WI77_27675 [Burkholderia ubonensis]KVD10937.1 hypothetical protein WI79_30800 [Burkholderia ubonensis]
MPLPALHTPHATRLARLSIALLIACAAVAPHHALAYRAPQTYGNEADLDRHDTYRNRDGETVHAPARSKSGRAPEGASARCRDGTYSFSRHRRGTCSGHGGVAAWL